MFVPRPIRLTIMNPALLAADRLTGTHITSNKPISVTLGDDSVEKARLMIIWVTSIFR